MKKFLLVVAVLGGCVACFAEKWFTGDNIETQDGTPLAPLDTEYLSFKSGTVSHASLTGVYKYSTSADTFVWCVEMTYPQLANNNSDSVYPVVFKWYTVLGNSIHMKDEYDNLHSYKIKDIDWNYIELYDVNEGNERN